MPSSFSPLINCSFKQLSNSLYLLYATTTLNLPSHSSAIALCHLLNLQYCWKKRIISLCWGVIFLLNVSNSSSPVSNFLALPAWELLWIVGLAYKAFLFTWYPHLFFCIICLGAIMWISLTGIPCLLMHLFGQCRPQLWPLPLPALIPLWLLWSTALLPKSCFFGGFCHFLLVDCLFIAYF